jgi:hypothetical protein
MVEDSFIVTAVDFYWFVGINNDIIIIIIIITEGKTIPVTCHVGP